MATYERCPRCGHSPLPVDQALPAACPACGVILAKVGTAPPRRGPVVATGVGRGDGDDRGDDDEAPGSVRGWLLHVPAKVDATLWRVRVGGLVALAVWGFLLARLSVRDGEMAQSFLHGPLLVFHEAGHVVFRPFGEWMTVAGGTLGQLLMPLVLAGALLWKNRDPYGAAVGLWLFGVSVLDVAPYLYDALHPQLVLLNGQTGEEGGHDWIYLLASVGRLAQAERLGLLVHAVGVGFVVLALGWGAAVLRLQRRRIAGDVLFEG